MPESWFELSSADQSEALEVAAGRSGRPAHLLENLRSRAVQEAEALYTEVEAENAQIASARPELSATMGRRIPLPQGHFAHRPQRDDQADSLSITSIQRLTLGSDSES
jgi:hypothetical protein